MIDDKNNNSSQNDPDIPASNMQIEPVFIQDWFDESKKILLWVGVHFPETKSDNREKENINIDIK